METEQRILPGCFRITNDYYAHPSFLLHLGPITVTSRLLYGARRRIQIRRIIRTSLGGTKQHNKAGAESSADENEEEQHRRLEASPVCQTTVDRRRWRQLARNQSPRSLQVQFRTRSAKFAGRKLFLFKNAPKTYRAN